MAYAHPFQEKIDAHIEEMKSIVQKGPFTPDSLEAIKLQVKALASNKDWWSEAHYAAPQGDENQARYLISEQPDQSYALYLNVIRPGKKIIPHNHTTWACIAAVEGVEHNYLYERIDDGALPGHAQLKQKGTVVVGPGDVIGLMPNDIHAVQIQGDKPIRHLHMYGKALETLTQRTGYDLDKNTCGIMSIGVQSKR
jgi:predicted metal-dependent enzyme (double-stranded beta helix superfamily)